MVVRAGIDQEETESSDFKKEKKKQYRTFGMFCVSLSIASFAKSHRFLRAKLRLGCMWAEFAKDCVITLLGCCDERS